MVYKENFYRKNQGDKWVRCVSLKGVIGLVWS